MENCIWCGREYEYRKGVMAENSQQVCSNKCAIEYTENKAKEHRKSIVTGPPWYTVAVVILGIIWVGVGGYIATGSNQFLVGLVLGLVLLYFLLK